MSSPARDPVGDTAGRSNEVAAVVVIGSDPVVFLTVVDVCEVVVVVVAVAEDGADGVAAAVNSPAGAVGAAPPLSNPSSSADVAGGVGWVEVITRSPGSVDAAGSASTAKSGELVGHTSTGIPMTPTVAAATPATAVIAGAAAAETRPGGNSES